MVKRNKWTTKDIPDQTGRIAIVTGANSGTGYETVKALASKGAHVVMGCRNLEKAETAKNTILSELPEASLEIIQLDLSDLQSVRNFVDEFSKKHQSLDLLINNAGIMTTPYRKTVDEFELQLGTNHFGHFALTGLLIDKIIATENSRIVTMSSVAHAMGKMDYEDLNWEKSYSRTGAYGRSKLANLLFTYELQRKLDERGNKTMSLASHPGWTKTNLQSTGLRLGGGYLFRAVLKIGNNLFAQKSWQGALPMLYAATDPEAESGAYYGPDGRGEWKGYPKLAKSSEASYNTESAKKLWELSKELTGVKYNFN